MPPARRNTAGGETEVTQSAATPYIHHIGVQTADLDNCISWYQDFFGCRVQWSTDSFSPLTRSRLPGISRLTEVAIAGTRFHLFERQGFEEQAQEQPDGGTHVQHVCLAAGSAPELLTWRRRWIELFESGRYTFRRQEYPTELVTDAQGNKSFYCFDVNGLEFELTHLSAGER